jgi:hypothetical protein
MEELRTALADVGLPDAPVAAREIAGEDLAFAGSPTILIDGIDVAPGGGGEPGGLTCRVYRLRDGRFSPTPDPDDLRAALRRAIEGGNGGI